MNKEEQIDITLVNQLKTLYGFADEELMEFYKAFKELDSEKKENLLIEFDSKLKERKKTLTELLSKLKLKNNQIDELLEKSNLWDINL